MSYSPAVPYFTVPKFLPIGTLKLPEIGLYSVIHSLNALPKDSRFRFTEKGLACYARGDVSAVRNALDGLRRNDLIAIRHHRREGWFEILETSPCSETSRIYNNGFVFSKTLSLEAKGVLLSMQLVLSSASRVLSTFLSACRNTIQKYVSELKQQGFLQILDDRNSDRGTFEKSHTYLCSSGEAVMELFVPGRKAGKSAARKKFTVTVDQNPVDQIAVAQNCGTYNKPNGTNSRTVSSNDQDTLHENNMPSVSTNPSFETSFSKSSINHAGGGRRSDEGVTVLKNEKRAIRTHEFLARLCKAASLEEINDVLKHECGDHYVEVTAGEYRDILRMLADRYASVFPMRFCGRLVSSETIREFLERVDAECIGTAIANICRHGGCKVNKRNYFLVTVIRQAQTKDYRKRMSEREGEVMRFAGGSGQERVMQNAFTDYKNKRDYTDEEYSALELAMRNRH